MRSIVDLVLVSIILMLVYAWAKEDKRANEFSSAYHQCQNIADTEWQFLSKRAKWAVLGKQQRKAFVK